jgi:hypothetical protein
LALEILGSFSGQVKGTDQFVPLAGYLAPARSGSMKFSIIVLLEAMCK